MHLVIDSDCWKTEALVLWSGEEKLSVVAAQQEDGWGALGPAPEETAAALL
jgi:hypothetical protein